MRIAVDAMSGDLGTSVSISGTVMALKKIPQLKVLLVGDKPTIEAKLEKLSFDKPRLSIKHSTEVVEMDDSPISALRHKKDSSMRVAIDLVHNDEVSGCISAGNTGALMATAKFVLKTIKHIDRPAICTGFPNIHGELYALDLGANIESSAKQLVQFAIMGSMMSESLGGKTNPSVGLMNIGSEEMKGTPVIKAANKMLKELAENKQLNYIGYAEGSDIYVGKFDVITMCGSQGNIALKASEGSVKLLAHLAKQTIKKSFIHRLISIVSYLAFRDLIKKANPSAYNGACLLGLRKIVVKSHGHTTVEGFARAIEVTHDLVKQDTVKKITDLLSNRGSQLKKPMSG